MVFVADALGGWLVGLLADAVRKKLTELVLGSEQKRALRQAAGAAVWATAEEMSPAGGEHAGRVAMVINQVFRDPVTDAPPARPVTLLEGLQAGIDRRLAVLDDAELTGTGQSSAEVLGVPGTVLAGRLTGHLVREIIVRGSGGGPLTPLAGQLNHDRTHLQGQRIEGMLARLVKDPRVHHTGHEQLGRPVADLPGPLALGVHQAVSAGDTPLPMLPEYVPREHDAQLQTLMEAADQASVLIALAGDSSTGKTRALWEALRHLPGQWRVWRPAGARALNEGLAAAGVGPRTVVWLDDAHNYLGPASQLAEDTAERLIDLIADPDAGPVLVAATLWPEHWQQLIAQPRRPPGRAGLADVPALFESATYIQVPSAFGTDDLATAAASRDPRLALALEHAPSGKITQYLAGAPKLIERYQATPLEARALIDAAVDARRFGHANRLPERLLLDAAPGYIDSDTWDQLRDDWETQALEAMTQDWRGLPGPLTRIRPRPGETPVGGPEFKLADVLEQTGGRDRRYAVPPQKFWAAAAGHALPGDQARLGDAARDRGLYQAAAQLFKNAIAHGDPHAGINLIHLLHDLHPADHRPAQWVVTHVSLDDPFAVSGLLEELQRTGADKQVTALADRDPATHVHLDDPNDAFSLLSQLREAGSEEQAAALANRAAALDHQSSLLPHRTNDDALPSLLSALRDAGADGQAVARVPLDDLYDVTRVLRELRKAGAHKQFTTLANRAAAHAPLDHPGAVARLLHQLRAAGAHQQVTTLAERIATGVSLDDPGAVARLLNEVREAGRPRVLLLTRSVHDRPGAVAFLLEELREAGAHKQFTTLANRAAAHAPVDHPGAVAVLLKDLRKAGAPEQAAALAARAADHVSLNDPFAVSGLLRELRKAGAHKQFTTLANRAAAHAPLDHPGAVASLLHQLREAGAHQQIAALAARDPAARVSLDDPGAVAVLLEELREVGAQEQVTSLVARDPATHVHLDDSFAVPALLHQLRAADAHQQVTTLADRLPGAGMFELFRRQEGHQDRFRFGREADGSPAGPWGWEDLD